MTFLLIGLGNPGASYAGNRHNIGFMATDRIAGDYGFSRAKTAFGGSLREGAIAGRKTYAFKPMGYMNNSGIPASELVRFYKIPPSAIIVFHDELDLPLGKVRVKRGGGHGGHNGLKSLDVHVGQDYWRVRLGIGHPGHKELVTGYVLADFSKAEQPEVESLLADVSTHVGILLHGDEAGFMNKLALRAQSQLP